MRYLLIFLLFLMGCGGKVFFPAKSTWHIDRQFTAAQKQKIDAAGDFWREKTKGAVDIRFDYGDRYTHPFVYSATLETPQISIQRKPTILGLAFMYRDVYLVLPQSDELMTKVMSHEIGHILGFEHVGKPYQLMSEEMWPHSAWGPEDQAQCEALGYCAP